MGEKVAVGFYQDKLLCDLQRLGNRLLCIHYIFISLFPLAPLTQYLGATEVTKTHGPGSTDDAVKKIVHHVSEAGVVSAVWQPLAELGPEAKLRLKDCGGVIIICRLHK